MPTNLMDWFLEQLRGDNIILRMSVSTSTYPQLANIARGEAFAYYCDDEMPLACHILYKAWVEQGGKTVKYELTQTAFPHWTAEWNDTIQRLTSSWGPDWLDNKHNVFMLIAPFTRVRVNSHPAILSHLCRMHGMLLAAVDDPFAQVLRGIACKRIDGAIKQMNSQWANTIGL